MIQGKRSSRDGEAQFGWKIRREKKQKKKEEVYKQNTKSFMLRLGGGVWGGGGGSPPTNQPNLPALTISKKKGKEERERFPLIMKSFAFLLLSNKNTDSYATHCMHLTLHFWLCKAILGGKRHRMRQGKMGRRKRLEVVGTPASQQQVGGAQQLHLPPNLFF